MGVVVLDCSALLACAIVHWSETLLYLPVTFELEEGCSMSTAVSLSQIIFVLFLVNESLEAVRSGQCVLAVHHTAG